MIDWKLIAKVGADLPDDGHAEVCNFFDNFTGALDDGENALLLNMLKRITAELLWRDIGVKIDTVDLLEYRDKSKVN